MWYLIYCNAHDSRRHNRNSKNFVTWSCQSYSSASELPHSVWERMRYTWILESMVQLEQTITGEVATSIYPWKGTQDRQKYYLVNQWVLIGVTKRSIGIGSIARAGMTQKAASSLKTTQLLQAAILDLSAVGWSVTFSRRTVAFSYKAGERGLLESCKFLLP